MGLYEDGQPGELFITMAKEGSTVGGLMDVIGTCTSMALQYGVPLVALVDKFRHARFEPSGMTSNKDMPFAKSLIDYIFCWLGCQFIAGYADRNIPSKITAQQGKGNKNTTTARQLVEKTKDLTEKIAQAQAIAKPKSRSKKQTVSHAEQLSTNKPLSTLQKRFGKADNRVSNLVAPAASDTAQQTATEVAVMQQFNAQFEHFQDDAPACDICGSITVRNGTCYKCFNCGNSMGCS